MGMQARRKLQGDFEEERKRRLLVEAENAELVNKVASLEESTVACRQQARV